MFLTALIESDYSALSTRIIAGTKKTFFLFGKSLFMTFSKVHIAQALQSVEQPVAFTTLVISE